MTIIINGLGAGVHALAWKLSESRNVDAIFCKDMPSGIMPYTDKTTSILSDPEDDIEIPAPKIIYQDICRNQDEYLEIPIFITGFDFVFLPVCKITNNGKLAVCNTDIFPSEDEKNKCRSFFNKHIFDKEINGLYSVSISNDLPFVLRRSLSDISACSVLSMIKGDMTGIYSKKNFKLSYRTGVSFTAALEGRAGQYIHGLSDIEGDIGVFINDSAIFGERLCLTGNRGLYFCCRNKNFNDAKTYLQKEMQKITLSDL